MSIDTLHNLQPTTDNKQGWKVAAWSGKHGRSIVWEKKRKLRLDLSESREVSSERKVKVIPCGGTEDGKGVGTNSRKSDMRVIFV